MTNRELAYIVKDQKSLTLPADEAVRLACRCMWERRNGSVLVVDGERRLRGIFTGRDAVRLLAKAKDAARAPLAKAMTRKPVTITPKSRAIDALRAMIEGGFRHVPVTRKRKSSKGWYRAAILRVWKSRNSAGNTVGRKEDREQHSGRFRRLSKAKGHLWPQKTRRFSMHAAACGDVSADAP